MCGTRHVEDRVGEEELADALRAHDLGHLVDDRLDRTVPVLRAFELRIDAVLALERAAALGLHAHEAAALHVRPVGRGGGAPAAASARCPGRTRSGCGGFRTAGLGAGGARCRRRDVTPGMPSRVATRPRARRRAPRRRPRPRRRRRSRRRAARASPAARPRSRSRRARAARVVRGGPCRRGTRTSSKKCLRRGPEAVVEVADAERDDVVLLRRGAPRGARRTGVAWNMQVDQVDVVAGGERRARHGEHADRAHGKGRLLRDWWRRAALAWRCTARRSRSLDMRRAASRSTGRARRARACRRAARRIARAARAAAGHRRAARCRHRADHRARDGGGGSRGSRRSGGCARSVLTQSPTATLPPRRPAMHARALRDRHRARRSGSRRTVHRRRGRRAGSSSSTSDRAALEGGRSRGPAAHGLCMRCCCTAFLADDLVRPRRGDDAQLDRRARRPLRVYGPPGTARRGRATSSTSSAATSRCGSGVTIRQCRPGRPRGRGRRTSFAIASDGDAVRCLDEDGLRAHGAFAVGAVGGVPSGRLPVRLAAGARSSIAGHGKDVAALARVRRGRGRPRARGGVAADDRARHRDDAGARRTRDRELLARDAAHAHDARSKWPGRRATPASGSCVFTRLYPPPNGATRALRLHARRAGDLPEHACIGEDGMRVRLDPR